MSQRLRAYLAFDCPDWSSMREQHPLSFVPAITLYRQTSGTTWRNRLAYGSIALAALLGGGSAWAQSADLVLSNHVVSPDPVPAQGIATITMTVQNNGTDAANGIKLTDTIPAGSTFVSMSASDGGICTNVVPYECTWGSLPFPGTRTVTLRVRLPSAQVWTNMAAVTSTSTDPNQGNNSLTRNITVQQAADLAITATSSAGGTIAAGAPYTYTLNVNNLGPDPLPVGQSPTVTFNVPAGSSIRSRPTGVGWTCQPASGYPLTDEPGGPVGDAITCTRDDGLATGNSFPPITVNAVGNVTGAVDAAFDVSSNYLDGDGNNNLATVSQPLSAGTDMSIKKTVVLAAGGGGTQASFTLTARQEGGTAPTGVTVTDLLPAGFAYVSSNGAAPWNCNFADGAPVGSAGTLTCTYPGTYTGGAFTDLPPITLLANVTGIGDIPNTGHVAATPPDPTGGNNTSTVIVNNTADLGITKASSLSPVVTGQNYDWNITLRNYGPMPLLTGQAVTVTETIPSGMTLRALPTSAGWLCSVPVGTTLPAAGLVTLTCTHTRSTPLAINSNLPNLAIQVVNTAAGSPQNNVCLALSGNGPTEAGNGPTQAPGTNPATFARNCHGAGVAGTDPLNSSDLQIVKTVVGPDPVVVGQPLTYLITATNLSATVNATNVHIYDTVNNLLSSSGAPGLLSVTPSAGSCTPSAPANVGSASIDCTLGTLNAGASATVTIVVRPNNATATDLTRNNTATVNSLDVGDPNRGNNTSTVTSVVQPRVDMTVSKTVNPTPVRVGQPMTYTVTANNGGPSIATNVRITDVMPPNTAFVSASTPSNGGTCGTVPTMDSTGQTLLCTWASVEPGGNRTVTFTVRPLPAALGTTITNTVTVATDSTETNLNNNTGTIPAQVIDSLVDILVQKTDSVDPVVLGAMTRYTVNIRNAGPSYGTNLVMTDTFPNVGNTARFSYQGNLTASVAGVAVATPTCTEPAVGATSGILTCTFPSLAVGADKEVVVQYDMRAESIVTAGDYSGTQGNHVGVKVDENEAEMGNNQVDEDTTTRRAPIATDLGLTKDVDKATITAGEELVYTLTVRNNGPLESLGAQVIDTLPAGMSFVSSADGCVNSAGTVTCAVGTLPVNESRIFHFTAKSDASTAAGTTLLNTGRLDAPGDINLSNNEDDAKTEVPGKPLTPTPVPTLGAWAMILLMIVLAGLGAQRLRRHAPKQ
ncbi:IPTL-CTERM sorting domain-containing protein [Diaphorobacter sp. HDW4B]|uniref:IPTL-CTERM sorting domain-containing protein n=1 Tax=Diaphorobacter sp. HDW4B TaxID=2714925 RepID=UPI00140A6DEB|nr:IPTL-CTERM sorting domain-containing protein [Diaphorobacter sp. HDW4B]QIL69135.1 IPTL-CTERM sorting domain-containing protein [Diaphorobacter sp. HDW4B]